MKTLVVGMLFSVAASAAEPLVVSSLKIEGEALSVVAHRGTKDVVRRCPIGKQADAFRAVLAVCLPPKASFHVVELAADGKLNLYASTEDEDLGAVSCSVKPGEKGVRAEALACAGTPRPR